MKKVIVIISTLIITSQMVQAGDYGVMGGLGTGMRDVGTMIMLDAMTQASQERNAQMLRERMAWEAEQKALDRDLFRDINGLPDPEGDEEYNGLPDPEGDEE